MRQWWRRIRGVLGMGLIWAVGEIGVGGLIELLAAGAGVTEAGLTDGEARRLLGRHD